LGEIFVGDWTCEATVDIDIEGICEKGDQLLIQASYEWAFDRVALIGKHVYQINGKTVAEGVSLTAWDAPKGQIRAVYFDSLGGSSQGVWRKRGGKWREQNRGVFADGRKSGSKATLIPVKDGNTHTIKATERVLGEETPPDQEFVYRRKK
jgi:hypothetical protein